MKLPFARLKGTRIAPALTEAQIQKTLVEFLRRFCPVPFFAVPNGGYRNPIEAARLKGQGVTAGVSDLIFILPGGVMGCMEMKAKASKGQLTPAQKAWLERAAEMGAKTAVCHSFEEATETLQSWGVTMTCRVTAAGHQ